MKRIITRSIQPLNKTPRKVHFLWALLASILILFLTAQTVRIGGTILQVRMYESQLSRIKQETQTLEKILCGEDKSALEQRIERFFSNALTRGQLIELAQRCWQYEIRVDGVKVHESPIRIQDAEVVIELIEREAKRFLPEEIHAMGSLTGGDPHDHFYTHLSYFADIPSEGKNALTGASFETSLDKQEPGEGDLLVGIYRVRHSSPNPDIENSTNILFSIILLPDPVLQSRIGLDEILLMMSP